MTALFEKKLGESPRIAFWAARDMLACDARYNILDSCGIWSWTDVSPRSFVVREAKILVTFVWIAQVLAFCCMLLLLLFLVWFYIV